MTNPTSQDLLMGGGGAFFTWAAKNPLGQYVTKPYGQNGRTRVAGHLARIGDVIQQTDYSTGALQTWTDGKPKQQFAITLDVDWQNTNDWDLINGQWQQVGPKDADDKQRGIMIKQSSALQGTLRDAIKQSGASGLQLGAYIVIELVAEVPGQGNPRKEFAVQYTPPAQGVAMGGQPQGQAPQQFQQPQYGQPAAVTTTQPAQQYQQPAPAPQQYVQQGQPQPQYAPQGQPGPAPQQYQQPAQQPPFQGAQPVGGQPQQAPAPQQGAPQAQDPVSVAKRLLHELKMPPEQVAAATGLTVEQVQQIPAF